MNCNFINNSAVSAGGAVCSLGDSLNISCCNFTDNTVRIGPAISLVSAEGYDPSKPHILSVNAEGGAVYIAGDNSTVNDCGFFNNDALLNGGAISLNWGNNVNISNSIFKNNNASYNGGAIDLNGDNPYLYNLKFYNNAPLDVFLNSFNSTLSKCHFSSKNPIESFYEYTVLDGRFGVKYFDEVQTLIDNTPEGGTVLLSDDYEFCGGNYKGITVSRPITIDGAGHSLNGMNSSRIFNVTSDNVVIKNIKFIYGNAFGRYDSLPCGGGAIHWSGANGLLLNSSFLYNHGWGIEDDPYDQEEIFITEDGMIIYRISMRPMGARTNEGGAIVWNGNNGTVDNCYFERNDIGYPNAGGAIYWRGDFGTIMNSEFYDNGAWVGAAVCWKGINGTILSSKFLNDGIGDNGIYWVGENGTVRNSIILGLDNRSPVNYNSINFDANYNFWGDTLSNPNSSSKPGNHSYWLVLNSSNPFINDKGIVLNESDLLVLDSKGNLFEYNSSQIIGKVDLSNKAKIVSKNLSVYYKSTTPFKATVYDKNGKVVANKIVKFTIAKKTYRVKTNKNGVASLKITQKPGKYTVKIQYSNMTLKKSLTVKTVLITKNLSKKKNQIASFKVKVLKSNGKAYPKRTVKIKFRGKTYTLKTNSNGIANLMIFNNLKVGKYTVKVSYGGLTNTNKIIVKK